MAASIIQQLASALKIDIVSHPEVFPLARQPIVETFIKIPIRWSELDLKLLAQHFNLTLHEHILRAIARVLPTPRAILNLYESLKVHGEVDPRTAFYMAVKDRYEEIIGAFKKAGIITYMTRWHEKFEKILKSGLLYIDRSIRDELIKVLDIKEEDIRKARSKVNQLLKMLSNIGVLDKLGPVEYALNKYLLAYMLRIERLPGGEVASLEVILERTLSNIKQLREKRRKKATS